MSRWLLFFLLIMMTLCAQGQDSDYRLTIRGHRFEPAELIVPAGQKIRLIIDNQDATPEEFESYELNREKVVSAQAQIVVFVGPLRPGRYPFFGDFHQDTAKGVLIVQ